jgi:Holliday junction DNA helicase RuvA
VIAFLQGVLTAKHPDRVEVDVNGVGYEVWVSQKTLQGLPAAGKNVLLKTYQHVREDTLQLFGFLKDSEKQAFLLGLSVSGVGPKAAMSILSTLAPDAFYQAVLHNDLTALRSIPGIGQKTAQHLVLELKDKVTKLTGGGAVGEEGAFNVESKNISDSVQALMGLGYSAAESRRAVLNAVQSLGDKSTVEEILRSSLKSIAAP